MCQKDMLASMTITGGQWMDSAAMLTMEITSILSWTHHYKLTTYSIKYHLSASSS